MSNLHAYRQLGTNRLLAALPPSEAEWITRLLEPVTLAFKQVLYEPGQPIAAVYFPLTCVVSLLVEMHDGRAVEVGTVGKEGMAGLPVFLGVPSTPGRALVQIPGLALRMPAETLVEQVLRGDGALYHLLQRYTQALFVQTAQGAACNRLHTQEQRFCRWMLLTHDRVGSDQFPLTHEFIAQMLGVRRATVSEVAAAVQASGLIHYHRGTMNILDRAGLEAASCECYAVIHAEFERIGGA
ncbi:MAG: Crp/Fnr family transcriptional regulator [Roseiflexaceae bacterium]